MNRMVMLTLAGFLLVSACANTVDSDLATEDAGPRLSTQPLAPDSTAGPSDAPATKNEATPGDIVTPVDDTGSTVLRNDVQDQVRFAITDLSAYLEISEDTITWVSMEEVTWPNSALGCPEPGTMYAQATVKGTLIILEVDGSLYEYHSAGDNPPLLCIPPASD